MIYRRLLPALSTILKVINHVLRKIYEISGGNIKEINVWLFVYLFVKHALVYY